MIQSVPYLVLLATFAGSNPQKPQQIELPLGKVIDSVRCIHAPGQSYSLYLPRQYSGNQKWPVVFLYDPAARGRLPVSLYAELAERFQLILVCSNNSRNGPIPPSLEAVEAVTQDILSRFSIDRRKVLISGFSGGSRLAMMVASVSGLYSGIIACGAGFFPNAQLPLNAPIPYFLLIGNRDPNFNEAIEVGEYLSANRYPHRIHYFEGGHDWPPMPEFRVALFWQVLHFQDSSFPYEDYIRAIIPTLKSEIDSNDLYLAYRNTLQCLTELDPANSTTLDSIRKFLEAAPGLQLQTEEFPELREKEVQLREQWNEQFLKMSALQADSAFHILDFDPLINAINKLKRSKSRQKRVLAQRLSGVMALRCHEQYNYQFKSEDYLHATMSSRILARVENSPRSYYMIARAWAARGIKKQSLNALAKAIQLGWHSKKQIEDDPYLSRLKHELRYRELLGKLK